ncbi:hypothetical protein NQ314_016181 [Rhamnusium bicolor]|uniref:Uncharacterized protein n=1 Tax=Rhamnusium bicolor TaxID=1586634 RepID=A0AAV8WXH7_9CUCU|nr:hypothetical protein NQ314_016181 [Rhamnusium bicolor]
MVFYAVNAIHLTETEVGNSISKGISLNESTNITLIPSYDPDIEQICLQPVAGIIKKTVDTNMEIDSQSISHGQINFICEVVYPEQLNLKVSCN